MDRFIKIRRVATLDLNLLRQPCVLTLNATRLDTDFDQLVNMRFLLLLLYLIKNSCAIVDMGLKPHVKTEVTLLELHDPGLPKSIGHSINGFGFQGKFISTLLFLSVLGCVQHPSHFIILTRSQFQVPHHCFSQNVPVKPKFIVKL